MIRVNGEFYFKYYGDDINSCRQEFGSIARRMSSHNLQIACNGLHVSNDSWDDMYDETYQIAVNMTINIDESFYCLDYDEHDIKKFVQALMQYNLCDESFSYSYVEDIHIEAIYDGKKRNSMYDHLCKEDKEPKPINVKGLTTNENGLKEHIGTKRRIVILKEDDEARG